MLAKEILDLRRTTRAEKTEQIKQAAFMFARVTRDADEIAAALEVSARTVQRLVHQPLFQAELARLGYEGEMRFRKRQRVKPAKRAPRGPERQQKTEYQRVKQLWHGMTDIPEHRRARIIADREDINASYTTVRRWCRDWRQKE